MPIELAFGPALLAKMGFAALVVLAVTITAERSGPLLGAFLATLPVTGGPAYILLALDHDAAFISRSAIFTLAMNPAIALFALSFVLLAAHQRFVLSIGIPLAVWLALALLVRSIDLSAFSAMMINVLVLPFCHVVARRYRAAVMPRISLSGLEILFRVALTVLVAALVVALSFYVGPSGSGILAVFPAVYVTVMLSLQRRVGGPAAAAMVAHGFIGMMGFSFAVLTLHFAAEPLGKAAALVAAFLVSLTWNVVAYGLRRSART